MHLFTRRHQPVGRCANPNPFSTLPTPAVVLALHHDDMDPAFEAGLTLANTVLIGLFTAELALKLLGLGVVGYLSDKVNVFDAIVVLISLVEVGLASDTECAAVLAHPPPARRLPARRPRGGASAS